MKLPKISTLASALLVSGLLMTSSANAFFLYDVSKLEDDNLEKQNVDLNSNKLLDVGDTLRGVIEINSISQVGGPGLQSPLVPELTGIFEVVVLTKTATLTPGLFNYTFGAYAPFAAEFGLLAGAAIDFWIGGTDLVIPGCASIAACTTAAIDGDHWLTLGFADADDEWRTSAPAPAATDLTGLPQDFVAGSFLYALSALDNDTGRKILEGGLFCFPGLAYACAGDGKTDVSGSGTILGAAGISNGFTSTSDFQYTLRVPEPGTMALLGLGLLGVGLSARRRAGK